jgi:uncharacterized protein (TIGR00251 family)
VQDSRDGATFAVRVAPRAGKTAITGSIGQGADAVIKIALAAPPVDGRANEALIAYLAGILDVTRSDIAITWGEQSRNKKIRVKGRTAEQVRRAIESAVL